MASEPPVLPDGGEGRRWAAEELAKPDYQKSASAWLEDSWQSVLEWLAGLDGPSGPPSTVAGPLIVVIAAVLIAVAVVLVRPRLNTRRKAPGQVYDAGTPVSADEYRERAESAAAAGDLRAAVVDRYRALVRAAEEVDAVDAGAGRTADEAATQLGRVYPRHARQLSAAAGVFDAVLYGNAAAARRDYTEMASLDSALQQEHVTSGWSDDSSMPHLQAPR